MIPRWKGRDAGILIAASVALLVSLGALTSHDEDAGTAAAGRLHAAASEADLSAIGLEGGIALSVGIARAMHTRSPS